MPEEKKEEYEIVVEGQESILKIDYSKRLDLPSIEDNPNCMSRVIEYLTESSGVSSIVLVQKRDYEYDSVQTQMLVEIANLFKVFYKNRELFGFASLVKDAMYNKCSGTMHSEVQELITRLMKKDPVGCYVELHRIERREKRRLEFPSEDQCRGPNEKFLYILSHLINEFEKSRLIHLAKPFIAGYTLGDREVYRRIFSPTIKPDFMYTKLMAAYPRDGTELDNYMVGDSEVTIFQLPGTVQYLYHVTPPEFKISEDKYEILDVARNIMADHKPQKSEFIDPERMRQVFYNIGKDLIEEVAEQKKISLRLKEIDELTDILVRYTIGFGLIEVLLADEKIQDISVNSPLGQSPIFVVHQDFSDCNTNIIPTQTEAESWATKLRLISGRPLDEANPILDTELELPGASTRVSAISNPLDPTGMAFSFRRHRDKPWTLPLFIKYKMIDSVAAGLISFLVDGTRTMLIAGTRSSGKSSFLGSILVEIMRRYRIITVEDTLELPVRQLRGLGYNIQQMKVASALATSSENEVSAGNGIRATLRLGDSALIVGEVRSSLRGDQEVVVVKEGLIKRMPIKDLENQNLKSFFLPTLDGEEKMKLKKLTGFVKHPKRTQLVKLTTKTGREVVVTPDHSVFTHVNFKIAAINTDQLKVGNSVIIPSKIPNGFKDVEYLNLLEIFEDDYRVENAEHYVRQAIKKLSWKKASEICEISDVYRYLLSTQKTRIPIKSFLKLMKEAKIDYDISDLRVKRGTSNSIPAKFPVNENVMRLIGYYLAEGNLDDNKIQITNSKPKIIEDVINICQGLGLKVSQRATKGWGTSVQMFISSKPLADLLVYLGCGKTSLHKRIPAFVYGLNERKICALLRGMYSGDGSITINKSAGAMIRYFSTAKKLVEDVAYALLSLGIVCRIHEKEGSKKEYRRCYVAEIKQRKYVEYFLLNIGFTQKKPELVIKAFSHTTDDSVCFDVKELERHLKLPRKYKHLRRTGCCSKDYLKKITDEVKCSDELYNFAHGEFFVDKVKSVEIINLEKPEFVYDLSVESTQRFIGGFGGILLHNTEAKALYEAMRVGAAANVVAGTIHGDSPYGVFDRVVNDIGVPKTSFKATDIIITANPVRSADGIHRLRRVTSISEVRKFWKDDPLSEGGFVDLMKYNPVTDVLEVTADLRNGESEILKAIGGTIKDFAGNWDAIWANIELRGKIRQKLVDVSIKTGRDDMLEAEFVIKANDMFHRIVEEVREEIGSLDNNRIYVDWESWLKREVKK